MAAFELPRHRGGLDSQELEILDRIARHASEALTRARRREDEMARERLAGELEVARNIQRHLLPDEAPLTPLVEFAAVTRPCEAVGGDSHDFVRLADGRIGVAVADVSGKGVPAAILMASVQASFRAMAETELTPGPLLAALNRRVLDFDQPDRFVCFFYGLIDPNRLDIRFSNSGLEQPVLFRAAGGRVVLDAGGLILGAQPGAEYEEGHLHLEAGDVLVCFSDGLVDAPPPDPPPLDIDAMEAVVRRHAGESADRLKREILLAAGFAEGPSPEDDVTVLVARIY
jgi:sigma-B regulation protein RsbU (phosphoserine phosphatase)